MTTFNTAVRNLANVLGSTTIVALLALTTVASLAKIF